MAARQGDAPSIRIQRAPVCEHRGRGFAVQAGQLLWSEEVAMNEKRSLNEMPADGHGGAIVVVIGSIATLGFLLLFGGLQ